MNKKGFTLIELLAVIVILAIIALIAIPKIANIIDESKLATQKISAQNYLQAVKVSLNNNLKMSSNITKLNGNYLINKEGNICIGELIEDYCNGEILEVDISGTVPTGGVIEIKNKEVKYHELYIDGNVLYDIEPTPSKCFETKENDDGTLTISRFICASKVWDFTQKKPVDNQNSVNEIKSVIIPFSIDGKLITNIGDSAFKQNLISDVIIPSSITNIENSAFYGNNITDIIIPGSVTSIGQWVFYKNKLRDLVISEGVKIIKSNAFSGNQIKNLSLPSTLTTIEPHAFRNNKLPQENAYIYKRNDDGSIDYTTIIGYGGELKDIEIPTKKNGVKLTTIGNQAFQSNELKSIVIPNGVTSIGEFAFYGNKLTNLIIPSGVEIIESYAFQSNQIKTLSLPSTLTTIEPHAFRNNKLPQESAYIYKRNSDGSIDYAIIIGYGGELKDIEIPAEKNGIKLTTIENQAFQSNELKSVVIPEGVIKIGQYAFYGNQLTNIEIPSTVIQIIGQAFYNNPFTSVTIKNSKENVTIGNQAFGTYDINNIIWESPN